jgi:hypothetical protein
VAEHPLIRPGQVRRDEVISFVEDSFLHIRLPGRFRQDIISGIQHVDQLPELSTVERFSIIVRQPFLGRRKKIMRTLLRVSILVEAGNAAAEDGNLGTTIEKILAGLKPEAAYFFADDNGNRSGSIVFDMKDSSEIPRIAEPWFLAFNANVSFRPVMNPQDLAKAGSAIDKAAKMYGK